MVTRKMKTKTRVVCHVDLDCFYVQVERQRDPSLVGVPCAVVQYNKWMGGGIIALSYEAKKAGVKRSMRGDEASKICPAIRLVTVPVHHEKADLTRYRDAGTAVFEMLSEQRGDIVCERTSIDEAYVDITALAAARLPTLEASLAATAAPPVTDVLTGTHVVGMERSAVVEWLRTAAAAGADDDDKLLVAGAVVAAQFRRAVRATLGYTLSAGIAHNKMLAKHASGMHKPFQQTLVRTAAVPGLLAELEIGELNGFGGKKGKELRENHDVRFVADLQRFSVTQLERIFGATEFAQTAYDACRGICHKEVKQKVILDSVGNSKTFTPPLTSKQDVEKYLGLLSEEVFARLETISIKHKRRALKINVSISRGKELVMRKGVEVSVAGGKNNVASKSAKMSQAEKGPAGLAKLAISLVQPLLEFAIEDKQLNVTSLGLIASELEEIPNQASMITRYLKISNRSNAGTLGDASVINNANGGNVDLATKTKPTARGPQATLAKEQCRKTGVIDANDVDPDTLKELPAELRASIERQISVQAIQAKDRHNQLHFNKLNNKSPPPLGQTKRKRTAGDISAQRDRHGSIASFLRPMADATAQKIMLTAGVKKTSPKLLPVSCSKKLSSSSTEASAIAHGTSSPAAVPGAVTKDSSAATTAHWACESCTFVNPPAYLICDMCHSLKQSPDL